MTYEEFLKSKVVTAPRIGFEISLDKINPMLKGHQKAIVQWMVEGGRRARNLSFSYS
jgi:hypothetical protein